MMAYSSFIVHYIDDDWKMLKVISNFKGEEVSLLIGVTKRNAQLCQNRTDKIEVKQNDGRNSSCT